MKTRAFLFSSFLVAVLSLLLLLTGQHVSSHPTTLKTKVDAPTTGIRKIGDGSLVNMKVGSYSQCLDDSQIPRASVGRNDITIDYTSYLVAKEPGGSCAISDPTFRKLRYSVLSLLLPWLYFMCVSINIPTMPKYVNWVINNGDTNVSELSAKVYGNLNGFDSLFTLLSVNLVGCLSDIFGRRVFMFISSLGIGAAFLIASFATSPTHFYLAGAMDGLTSCMLSQSQAYITDHQSDSSNLSIALSKFQGIAIGCAFMVGIPLGAQVHKHFGMRAPLHLSVAICAVNCLLIATLLPKAPSHYSEADAEAAGSASSSKSGSGKSSGESSVRERLRLVNWSAANPLGALRLLAGSRRLLVGGLAFCLINIAQCGVQVSYGGGIANLWYCMGLHRTVLWWYSTMRTHAVP